LKRRNVAAIASKTVMKPFRLLQGMKDIYSLITDQKLSRSYYPAAQRKNRIRIYLDHLAYYIRYREINSYYYLYGSDRKGDNAGSHLAWASFRKIRDERNLKPYKNADYNYVCLLRDKFVFSQFASSLHFPTPKNVALCDGETITWLDQMRTVPIASLVEDKTIAFDAFCKILDGSSGRGAFPLKVSDGRLLINDDEVTLAQLKAKIGAKYLIQERVQQHPTMNLLSPHSINTVRLVTFNQDGVVRLFSAACRIGTNERSVDNWSAGGVVVSINPANGQLCEDGIYKPGFGGIVRQHPQTRVTFQGFEIPHFHDAVQLVTRLHSYFYGIHSIGWDVAIRPEGPIIIEGNDSWDGGIPMALEPDFKRRFLSMYSMTT
jgi:hypothetical protein